MLVAPAGWGKTTLARQWLDERPHGWYRGSAASADAAGLAGGLAKAARAILPHAGRRMMERLAAAGAPPPKTVALAELLADDLLPWPDEAWLAIDDYHYAMESSESETLVEELLARCPVRLLVTSRARPRWATARRMLYGEILEIGGGVLALTHDEARQVLRDRRAEEVAGLMAITEGWPAVIGLASLSTAVVLSEVEFPDALYSYCAEELFQKLPVVVRNALATIALVPSISVEVIRGLYGDRAARIADAAEEGGFLARGRGGDYDVHPLLRSFLLRKLEEQGPDATAQAVRDLAEFLLAAEQWDDALAVAARSSDAGLLERAIDGALDDLISEGRLETLKQWIGRARSDAPSAVLDIAEAEVAFREGDPFHALLRATNAASQFPDSHPRLSRSWFRAGQAAYFLGRADEARELCERAKATARNSRDAKNALWGLFNAALDLDDQRADALLQEIESARPLTIDEEVRVAAGSLFFASRWGGIQQSLTQWRGMADRLSGADPVVEAGFLNSYANALILAAQYTEAISATETEIERAREASIDFVVPHGLLLHAMACLGARRFRDGAESIRAAERHAPDDAFVKLSAASLQARSHLFAGRPDEAMAALTRRVDLAVVRSLHAEFLATRALALAALRRWDDAVRVAGEALETSTTAETQVLVACVRAIAAIGRGTLDGERLAEEAFRTARRYGNLDGFVCAYRTFPGLLISAATVPEFAYELADLVSSANDLPIARRAGLEIASQALKRWDLTKREEEVLRLIGEGMTNRQIAQKLFVAEVTVKVHVRHVLQKLGVRTRTEAAVRAANALDEED